MSAVQKSHQLGVLHRNHTRDSSVCFFWQDEGTKTHLLYRLGDKKHFLPNFFCILFCQNSSPWQIEYLILKLNQTTKFNPICNLSGGQVLIKRNSDKNWQEVYLIHWSMVGLALTSPMTVEVKTLSVKTHNYHLENFCQLNHATKTGWFMQMLPVYQILFAVFFK